MNKVYGFTNEFVAAYPSLYNFDNADVLSVLGSGDQYFTAMLAGAKDVTVFDINKNTWYHFVLKFMAIRYLSYEEFCKFFIEDGLNNIEMYLKIRDYLPKDVKKFFDIMKFMKVKFSNIKRKTFMQVSFEKEDYVRMLPFLKEESYYKLQDILRRKELPKCVIQNFGYIALGDERKDYDLVLLSNIFYWMELSPKMFTVLLDKFDSSTFQACYVWLLSGSFYNDVKEFESLGYELSNIPAVKATGDSEGVNYVLTYKRRK